MLPNVDPFSRRDFLKASAVAGVELVLPSHGPSSSPETDPSTDDDYEFGFAVGDTLFRLSEDDLQTRLDLAAGLGASLLRLDFDMSKIRAIGPAESEYNWGELDHVIESSRQRNFGIVGLLAYSPDWARDPSCDVERTCGPRDTDDFAVFAQASAERYTDITKWEVWNEPNTDRFWRHPDAEAYSRLFVATAEILHSVNPSNEVCTAGLTVADTDGINIHALEFLEQFLITEPYGMDAIGVHPNTSPLLPSDIDDWSLWQQIEGNSALPNMDSIYELLQRYGYDLPIWITEYGAPSGGNGDNVVSEDRQADMIREALSWRFERARIPVRLIFNLNDGYPQGSVNSEDHFGVYHVDNTPKPAVQVIEKNFS